MKTLNQYILIRLIALFLFPLTQVINQEVWTQLVSLQKTLAENLFEDSPNFIKLRQIFDYYEKHYIAKHNKAELLRARQKADAFAEHVMEVLIAAHERGRRPTIAELADKIIAHCVVEAGKPAKQRTRSN